MVGGPEALATALADGAHRHGGHRPTPGRPDQPTPPSWPAVDGAGPPRRPRRRRCPLGRSPSVQPAVLGRAVRVVAVTGSGGAFGQQAGDPDGPLRATGVRGLIRTLAREYPDRHVRSIDVDPTVPSADLAELIRRRVHRHRPRARHRRLPRRGAGDRRPGRGGAGRRRSPTARPTSARTRWCWSTGGARGITARAALALARTHGCRLELVGPLPAPDGRGSPVRGRRRPGRHCAGCCWSMGELTTPAQIEQACDGIQADREVRATLAELEALGVPVTYHSVDVRDGAALGALRRRHLRPPRPPRRRGPRRRGARRPVPPRQDGRGLRAGVRHQGRRGPHGARPPAPRPAVHGAVREHQRRARQPRPDRLLRGQRRPRRAGAAGLRPPRWLRSRREHRLGSLGRHRHGVARARAGVRTAGHRPRRPRRGRRRLPVRHRPAGRRAVAGRGDAGDPRGVRRRAARRGPRSWRTAATVPEPSPLRRGHRRPGLRVPRRGLGRRSTGRTS